MFVLIRSKARKPFPFLSCASLCCKILRNWTLKTIFMNGPLFFATNICCSALLAFFGWCVVGSSEWLRWNSFFMLTSPPKGKKWVRPSLLPTRTPQLRLIWFKLSYAAILGVSPGGPKQFLPLSQSFVLISFSVSCWVHPRAFCTHLLPGMWIFQSISFVSPSGRIWIIIIIEVVAVKVQNCNNGYYYSSSISHAKLSSHSNIHT